MWLPEFTRAAGGAARTGVEAILARDQRRKTGGESERRRRDGVVPRRSAQRIEERAVLRNELSGMEAAVDGLLEQGECPLVSSTLKSNAVHSGR